MNNITLTLIELFISLIVESVILSGVFMFISNKASEKQQQFLQSEITNIEKQNKFDFEQLQTEIRTAAAQCISEVKEAHAEQIRGIERMQTQQTNSTHTIKPQIKWNDQTLISQMLEMQKQQRSEK